MSDYWKIFWDRHAAGVPGHDPLRQVLRVQNRQPISEAMFSKITDYVVALLELDADHVVLDLCCGNGLLCAPMADRCKQVVGVDFCDSFVQEIQSRQPSNVVATTGDALNVEFASESFHRILLAAALQHFSQPEVVRLFGRLHKWLKPGGILLVTDILDARRMWSFYDSREREAEYFRNVLADTPILGTWFDRGWMEKLGHYVGFGDATALDQPVGFVFAHYRFDVLCRK